MSNAKKAKLTGLASFAPPKAAPMPADEAGSIPASPDTSPNRGETPAQDAPVSGRKPQAAPVAKEQKPRIKQFPMRMTVKQWKILKELAIFEEKTLTSVILEGCDMLLKSKGMKFLDED
jgi:hypothetical protein